MKADSYVKHGDVKALVCTVNKEKEKEKGPPCHYSHHPPADAEIRERRRSAMVPAITAMAAAV